MLSSFRWAIVDIETTGFNITRDEITEIGVHILTELGIVNTWHRLIKPKRSIPDPIRVSTGISDKMLQNAPLFADIAEELLDILKGCIFVAHNARFDFGFIKNAFKQCGITYRASVLCTIKLIKQLYPNLTHYNLASVANTFSIALPSHHRALADSDVLYQIIQQIAKEHHWPQVLSVAKAIYQQSSIPSKLITDVSTLPETPGVYIFYGEKNGLPLYIGKSIALRQRILSHFSGDYAHAKEFTLSQQVARIEIIPTAGELSALLLESEMIKKHMPVYNRKLRRTINLAGFQLIKQRGYLTVSIRREQVEGEEQLRQHGLYGAFRSINAAKNTLLEFIKSHELCPKLCGVEHGNGACFSFQLKRCKGACVQIESCDEYNKRLLDAFTEYQEDIWPYKGAIAIKEECSVNKITQFSVFYQWRHLGSVNDENVLDQWRTLANTNTQPNSTYDTYKIIRSYLEHQCQTGCIIELT